MFMYLLSRIMILIKEVLKLIEYGRTKKGAITFFKGIGDSEGYEIGCQIYRKEDRGKGYAMEAIKLFSSYIFEIKAIERLQVCTAKENVAARKVAEKSGFIYEGTLRKAFFARGKYHDLDVLSMLREESASFSELLVKT